MPLRSTVSTTSSVMSRNSMHRLVAKLWFSKSIFIVRPPPCACLQSQPTRVQSTNTIADWSVASLGCDSPLSEQGMSKVPAAAPGPPLTRAQRISRKRNEPRGRTPRSLDRLPCRAVVGRGEQGAVGGGEQRLAARRGEAERVDVAVEPFREPTLAFHERSASIEPPPIHRGPAASRARRGRHEDVFPANRHGAAVRRVQPIGDECP